MDKVDWGKSPRAAIRRFEKNDEGRDFVVGDIHGEFSLALEALEAADFDGRVDRLFCVGDLIDRGSENDRVLDFLEREGVYAILGNHEEDLAKMARLSELEGARWLDAACREMDMAWWLDVGPKKRQAIVEAFERLPLAFEIQTEAGLVAVVHAEPLPSLGWAYFKTLLEAGEELAVESCLRGREVAEGREQGSFGDVWRVFAGHTPAVGGVGKWGNLFCVDTGAVFGKLGKSKSGHLTLCRIDAPESELLSERSMAGLFEVKGASPVLSPEARSARPS